MGELAKVALGPESSFDLELKEGKVHLSLVYDGAQLDGSIAIAVDALALVEKLEVELSPKIPLGLGGAIFAALKGVIKS